MKRAVVAFSVCALLWLISFAVGNQLARHDVIAGLLRGELGAFGSVALALGLRLFLILLAPIWLVWLAIDALERRFTRARAERDEPTR